MPDRFTVRPLTRHHDRGRFSSGQPDLDRYLHELARKQDENDTTRVHLYANDAGDIAGYYTLSPVVFEVTGLPPIDRRYRGRRLGSFLLSHAMRNAAEGSGIVASGMLVIDAKPDALDWYLSHEIEFERLPGMPLRLLLPMEAIRAELDRSGSE